MKPKSPPPAKPTSSAPPASAPAASGGGAVRTVTVTQQVTVTRTVPAASPSVPAEAHVPSSLPALADGSFTVPGGNIGCRLGGGAARCDIASSVWAAPAKPRSCGLAWGQGLAVAPGGVGHFVCAGDSVLDPGGAVVPPGRDDATGGVTCQVRTVGVTCFDAAGRGFFISRTGYYTF